MAALAEAHRDKLKHGYVIHQRAEGSEQLVEVAEEEKNVV